jgi:hypothetical protein
VLAPAVVRNFPLRIDDRPLPDFDDAIAGRKPNLAGSRDEIDMRPLVLMIMDVVGDLAEQNAFDF